SSTSNIALFSSSQSPDSLNFHIHAFRAQHSSSFNRIPSPVNSHETSSSPSPVLQDNPDVVSPSTEEGIEGSFDEEISKAKKSLEDLLVIRRPVMEIPDGEPEEIAISSALDEGLSRFARNMPIFEPERMESSSEERPLPVNLDLALYKAKILTRNRKYEEAEILLRKCISNWPEDGRPYVALGKALSRQSKWIEARSVYEKGCQATQGENSYIWQCWAVLENRMGNVRRSRELFDAATVADRKHIAAWHGWAVLEMKEGNAKKARYLLGRALKHCGGNEYVYQTLALLEVKARRFVEARHFFRQATRCNSRSCASWL
ncbi:protein high chlorophyll fluorescent 107, partial [Genlisea aurea]